MEKKIGHYDIIVLFSGGLDSMLACKLIQKQSLKILAIKFAHPFTPGFFIPQKKLYFDAQLGTDVLEIPVGKEFLDMISNPAYGYGANANPCKDCKIFFLRLAKEIANETGAKGIATGEVVGQRPFSQTADAMKLIEQETGLSGKIIRPLCAKRLPPTQLELDGIIDREKLMDIHGRGRDRQMQLARELGVVNYQSPAGGCLLTDPQYAKRFFDAKRHGELSMEMAQLLKIGRHFRIDGKKLVIGRNGEENSLLKSRFSRDALLLFGENQSEPCGILSLDTDKKTLLKAASIFARYFRKPSPEKKVVIGIISNGIEIDKISVVPASPIWAEKYLVG